MATEVFQTEEIVLQDGTEVELRPLVVGKMRKAMRIWSDHLRDVSQKVQEAEGNPEKLRELNDADFADAQWDATLKIVALALEPQLKKEKTTKQFNEYLEETLDDPTINKILAVCANLKLNLAQESQTD